jgi:hypothetical protein
MTRNNPTMAAAVKQKGSSGLHLYVMQAATGRIKIGRSSNPRSRRDDLQSAIGQPLFLLNVFKDRGSEERAIHTKLAEWREFGEWFANCGPSRQAIGEAIGARIGFRVFENLSTSEAIPKAIAAISGRAPAEAALAEVAASIRAEGGRLRRSSR